MIATESLIEILCGFYRRNKNRIIMTGNCIVFFPDLFRLDADEITFTFCFRCYFPCPRSKIASPCYEKRCWLSTLHNRQCTFLDQSRTPTAKPWFSLSQALGFKAHCMRYFTRWPKLLSYKVSYDLYHPIEIMAMERGSLVYA